MCIGADNIELLVAENVAARCQLEDVVRSTCAMDPAQVLDRPVETALRVIVSSDYLSDNDSAFEIFELSVAETSRRLGEARTAQILYECVQRKISQNENLSSDGLDEHSRLAAELLLTFLGIASDKSKLLPALSNVKTTCQDDMPCFVITCNAVLVLLDQLYFYLPFDADEALISQIEDVQAQLRIIVIALLVDNPARAADKIWEFVDFSQLLKSSDRLTDLEASIEIVEASMRSISSPASASTPTAPQILSAGVSNPSFEKLRKCIAKLIQK